jgi:GT2 family glycosyltransferase
MNVARPRQADFDVVIATFNAPLARLARSVRSAIACDGAGRVVVVDDGSTPPVDESALHAAILSRAADAEQATSVAPTRTHPSERPWMLVRQENAGPSAARNAGIEASLSAGEADAIVFLDDDDELIPAGVAIARELAKRLSAAGVVSARVHVTPDGRETLKRVPPEWAGGLLPHASDVLRPIGLFGASGCMARRAALAAGVRFDPGLRLGEDRDFLHRVSSFSGGLAVCDEPVVRVAIHESGGNLTSPAHFSRRIRDHLTLLDRYDDPIAREHLRVATRWLVNNAAKSGVDAASWRALTAAASARGWTVPIKALLRRMISRLRDG